MFLFLLSRFSPWSIKALSVPAMTHILLTSSNEGTMATKPRRRHICCHDNRWSAITLSRHALNLEDSSPACCSSSAIIVDFWLPTHRIPRTEFACELCRLRPLNGELTFPELIGLNIADNHGTDSLATAAFFGDGHFGVGSSTTDVFDNNAQACRPATE